MDDGPARIEEAGDAPRGSRAWRLALGPALATLILILSPGDDPSVARMAAIAAWMAAWWITEALPFAVTALLPLVLIPVAGILPVDTVARNYGRSVVFLFLGGFLLALGLQQSGVHRRIALRITAAVGSEPARLVLGFMLATWALSMWISNTSTTMLMLPIVLSVLQTARDRGAGAASVSKLGLAMLLGVAYSANMGGMATLVGTPPNLVFVRIFGDTFPEAPTVSFLQWSMLALPLSAVFLVSGWLLLTRFLFRLPAGSLLGGRGTVRTLLAELGPVRRDEAIAASVFGVTALLWLTSAGVSVGDTHLPGWRELTGLDGMVDDATVAIAMAIVLFAVPSADRPGERLLEWRFASEVPWGLLLLFGGGIALAHGFVESGLSAWAGHRFVALQGLSPWLLILGVCVLLTLLTELTSNLATADMLLPILATAAINLGLDPRALMIPATLSASCAFMMPVATPPAAIVFGSGLIPIRQMVRAGIWFNLLGVILVLGAFALLAGPALGIEPGIVPVWARQ